MTTKEIKDTYFNALLPLIQELDTQKQQKRERILIQETFKISFFDSFPDEIISKNKKLFTDEIVGTGYGMNTDNTYINIGKYLVHRNNLLGGKLQVRSPNKNQVYGFKSQNITNNIKDILLKLNKKEPITFKDVDKLNEQEKNQLYTIGKKLHVSELFDIPSTLKSNKLTALLLLQGALPTALLAVRALLAMLTALLFTLTSLVALLPTSSSSKASPSLLLLVVTIQR